MKKCIGCRVRGLSSLVLLATWVVSLAPGFGMAANYATLTEETGYRRTASYEETVAYYQRLADQSRWVTMAPIGKSPQGRDLHLVVVAKDGEFTPEAARASGKVVVLIQNGIHAGEIDGKDACMALVRDIALTKRKVHLLENVILLIIPIFSVDGHEDNSRYTRPNQDGPENAGFRGTAQRLNLNRDYLKLDCQEMRVWVANWLKWMPDFFIDDHVTDGQDWQYTVTYKMAWHPNADAGLVNWTKTYFDSAFVQKTTVAGYKTFPYAFPFRGAVENGVTTFADTPRFSTGYTVLWNRPGLLVEMHSLKDYRTRVLGNTAALVSVLEILNAHGDELKTAIAAADRATREGLTDPYPLTFSRVEAESVMVDIHTYKASRDSSTVTGGWARFWDRSAPITVRAPYFGTFEPRQSVVPPRAYLIPREWTEQIALLRMHGVRLDTLTQALTTPVELYSLDSVDFADNSFESHVRVSYQATLHDTTLTFPTGTVVVDMHQTAAKVVMQALEPDAPDCLLSWGMWNTVFERKEYIGDYMIDPLADSMITADAELRGQYDAQLASDTSFAKSARARRDFFYKRSRFYEAGYNWYPVARLLSGFLPPIAPWEGR